MPKLDYNIVLARNFLLQVARRGQIKTLFELILGLLVFVRRHGIVIKNHNF